MLLLLNVDGVTYTANDDPLKLLAVLRRHLDKSLDDTVDLTGEELLTLKGWLVNHAESMPPGKAQWLEETINGESYKVVAAIGRADDGSVIVWHEPLPWPFDFKNDSGRIG